MSQTREKLFSDNLIPSPEEAEKKLNELIHQYYQKNPGGSVVVLRKSRAEGSYKIEIKIAVQAEKRLKKDLRKKENHETKAYKLLSFEKRSDLVLHKGAARGSLAKEANPETIIRTIDNTVKQHIQLEMACDRPILDSKKIVFISQNGHVYDYMALRSLQDHFPKPLETLVTDESKALPHEKRRRGFVRLTEAEKDEFRRQIIEKQLENLKQVIKTLDELLGKEKASLFDQNIIAKKAELNEQMQQAQEKLNTLIGKVKKKR